MPENTQNLADVTPGGEIPNTDEHSSQALDDLLKAATDAAGDPPGDKPVVTPDPEAAAAKLAAEKAAADAAAAAAATPPDDFDRIELPPNVKPKTGEAFDNVKKLAREKLLTLEAEAKTLREQVETSKQTKALTPEVEKELAELRNFRKSIDVEADPEFQRFDVASKADEESIYNKLTAAGVEQATIDKIKQLGGVAKIEWDPILEKLPPVTRRFVEAKLVAIEEHGERKTKAVAEAKKNADQFLAQRAGAGEAAKKAGVERADKAFNELAPKLDWLKERKVDKDCTAEQAAAHNKLVKEATDAVRDAMADDSPEMRAITALSVAQLMKARVDLAGLQIVKDAEITKLKADLAAANALIAKIKNGSTNRLRNSTAPTDTNDAGKPVNALNEKPGDALDRHMREAQAAQ